MAGPPILQALLHSLRQAVPEPTLGHVAIRWIDRQLRLRATTDQKAIGRSFIVREFGTSPAVGTTPVSWCVSTPKRTLALR